jgi:hypothetical protein
VVNVNIKIDNLKETSAALKRLPEDLQSNVIDASWDISQKLAKAIRTAARANGPQTALLAGTVATGEAIAPVVTVGGSQPLPTKGKRKKRFTAYQDVFGAEFGASFLPQFKPRNKGGYFIYPTVDAMAGEINEQWTKAADKAILDYAEGA